MIGSATGETTRYLSGEVLVADIAQVDRGRGPQNADRKASETSGFIAGNAEHIGYGSDRAGLWWSGLLLPVVDRVAGYTTALVKPALALALSGQFFENTRVKRGSRGAHPSVVASCAAIERLRLSNPLSRVAQSCSIYEHESGAG